MNIIDIILKKKNKKSLTREEIYFVIEKYLSSDIKDYQMSALLMAICLNKMTIEETIDLTNAMIDNGKMLDLSSIDGIIVDKHSTGGIGDKVTLVLVPLLASLGLKTAKMSGRGLGFTGGTIDKLESIKGFDVNIDNNRFIKQINDIGASIISSNDDLVPADKKIYALRDVSGTVENTSLIASSIMSKKIITGANIIIIDLKVGTGALIKDIKSAKELAYVMKKIGESYNKKVICCLSNMDEVLGNNVGNGLEVIEAIETLKGNGPTDLEELVITLGAIAYSLTNKKTLSQSKSIVKDNLYNEKAYNKFLEIVKSQNGNINDIEVCKKYISIKSIKSGYITKMDALSIGKFVMDLGAGRKNKDDKIDYGVGISLSKKVGDYINKGEEILKIYSNKNTNEESIINNIEISNKKPKKKKLIYEII